MHEVAGTIAVALFCGNSIEHDINSWLKSNPELEIIDIKFSASATSDDWGSDALIIYRKEG